MSSSQDRRRSNLFSLMAVAMFSRHAEALDWATGKLVERYGPVRLQSPDWSFHHTSYYAPTMGPGLRKRIVVFERTVPPDCLPEAKHHAIALEAELAATQHYAETRPINIDSGLLQLGKFLLASTKDHVHRIYLRDNIFAEVTLRFTQGVFEPWPWTFTDYREPEVVNFLGQARAFLYEKVVELRANPSLQPGGDSASEQ